MVDDDAGGDGDVHGVLRSVLRNLQATVGSIDHFLMDALHLVAQHNGIALPRFRMELGKFRGALGLLDAQHRDALAAQRRDGLERRREVAPLDAVLCPQCRLVDLAVGRTAGDAAQTDGLEAEGIGRAQHRPYVVHRPHIVHHDHQRHLLGLAVFLHREPLHLYGA